MRIYRTRLLTWVPGTQLCQVRPQSPELLQSLGSFLGGMDRALEDFSHPAQDRELKWDLRRAGQVVETHLEYVEDQDRRDLLSRTAQRFLERLAPLVPELRLSVIHADGNDHNVLVDELGQGQDPTTRKVSGMVDFGDAVRSYTAGEAAIAGAYAMLEKGDPIASAAHVVRGYHRALPLREAEIAALFPLMGLRLCASVAISAHQKRREPENEYLTVSEAPAWALLERLDGEIPELAHLLFREACGLDPVPAAGRIVDWLKTNGEAASPVVARAVDSDVNPDGASLYPRRSLYRTSPRIRSRVGFPGPSAAPDALDAEAWTDADLETNGRGGRQGRGRSI